MATMNVTISGIQESDISYAPSDAIVKPDDTVVFSVQNLADYLVTISWDVACPMNTSGDIQINGSSLQPSANRTVSSAAADGRYLFTVSFQAIVPPKTEEEPEEPGPTHGGLEVSREN